ncbi:hypothetical protein BD413DRAFT_498154 [Trametes elegans]|nr:hypothetical protein BD413DRAFT_498154 [Trametes elegans]
MPPLCLLIAATAQYVLLFDHVRPFGSASPLSLLILPNHSLCSGTRAQYRYPPSAHIPRIHALHINPTCTIYS